MKATVQRGYAYIPTNLLEKMTNKVYVCLAKIIIVLEKCSTVSNRKAIVKEKILSFKILELLLSCSIIFVV